MNATRPPRISRGGLRFSVVLLAVAALAATPVASRGERPAPPNPDAASLTAGHQSEGLRLVAQSGESAGPATSCPPTAAVRAFDVVALNVDITLNRYLDHDPQGRMYALASDVPAIRDEERRNAAARAHHGEPAVTMGLQGDAIQPLTLRVHPGECVRVKLTNQLHTEPASLHVHGAPLRVAGGGAAIATNAASYASPGTSVTYEWAVPADEPEGTHYFHSHGNDRLQTSHGLFGAIIVEPKGAAWTDPRTGKEATGWDAIVAPPGAAAFREFVLYYHEVGDELYLIDSGAGGQLPLVDPILADYRPGSRALNYRSEPFMNRMRLEQVTFGTVDESMSYSSYAFGDPATPVLRSYVGEPTRMRIVHGGSEVMHVHHVHGGSIRWPRRPGVDPDRTATGSTKQPDLLPGPSERTDAQSIGPSETFDTDNECGAGGCQGSVGDFMVHCHVAHHYFAGMWGIWRVYNTRQVRGAQTDDLPPLRELPDRVGRTRPAVPSSSLSGTTVRYRGAATRVGDGARWAASQLPPPGVARGYDASVWDWTVERGRVAGEPSDSRTWPGHVAHGSFRPPVLFDPATGRLAYPFLHPHLAKRPPFAPGHSPAPYLDPPPANATAGDAPPKPGTSGPESLCPAGTTVRAFRVDAMPLSVPLNQRAGLVDPDGELYVLAQDRAALLRDPSKRLPLVIRANARRDCVDVVFASTFVDSPENHGFAKADMHIHFVQFDVQGSDGVVTGFNFEQGVRPYTIAGTTLRSAAGAGATTVPVANADAFRAGVTIGIGLDTVSAFEARRVVATSRGSVTLDAPLQFAHRSGERVSTEFVRYRWYPDAQTGTAYFHDHVNAIDAWKHGLFGALIVEPPDSTYTDPVTGAAVHAGPIADVHTRGRISADVTGSFREAVILLQDDVPITSTDASLGGAIDMRAEPMRLRSGDPFDPRGPPPATPMVRANLGDPVVFRTLVAATNDVHTFHVDGHWFRIESFDPASPPASTVHVGISERFDLVVPFAGGPQRMPGDYLYADGRSSKMREGAWGIFRVFDGAHSPLRPLEGRTAPSAAPRVCPAGAPVRRFEVRAVASTLEPELAPPNARVFVLAHSRKEAAAEAKDPQPLVLHAGAGDCVRVTLANDTDRPASIHADLMAYAPAPGRYTPEPAPPGGSRTYELYASPDLGEHAAMLRDLADPSFGARSGLYGAIVIGPAGARFTTPDGDRTASGAEVTVVPARGPSYRDITVLSDDDDQRIGTHQMPYVTAVHSAALWNLGASPIAPGASAASRYTLAPGSRSFRAYAGDPVRMHVLAPAGEQPQVFSVEGNEWQSSIAGGRISSTLYGGLSSIDLTLIGGASAGSLLPGDYVVGDHREPFREAGMWTLLRVSPTCVDTPDLSHLPGLARPKQCGGGGPGALIALALLGGAGVFGLRNVRRLHRLSRGRRAT